jgi:hypothetical protein
MMSFFFREDFWSTIENTSRSALFTRAQLECFISDKARTASVLNGLKNDPSDEFIGEVIL